MAEMKNSLAVPKKVKKECERELEKHIHQLILCKGRRSDLIYIINQEHERLHGALKKFPLPSSPAGKRNFKKNYSEFKRSYDLFCMQMENVLSLLKIPVRGELIPVPKNEEISFWEDYRYDLLDAQKDNVRIIAQYEREGFLSILQILDTAERLQDFSFPNKGVQGKTYEKALKKLQSLSNYLIRQTILKALNRRKINEILLLPESYPPVTTTRIISRSDNLANDEIVVSRVIEKGYFWRTGILRKAAVEVKTKI